MGIVFVKFKIKGGRKLRVFLSSAYYHGFSFVIVKFQFVSCHPVFHVLETVGGTSQEWEYVVRFVFVLQLCVVSVEVMVEVM